MCGATTANGAFGAFLKFPPGFVAPLHTHTNEMKIVIIGPYTKPREGKRRRRWDRVRMTLQPGGNYRHMTACDKASECEFFIQSSGKFDIKPAEKK